MNDYNELNLYLYEDEEPITVDLWVHTEPNKFFIIKNVNANPVCYEGWWSIPHLVYNASATAHIEADKVLYFTSITKDDNA